MKTLILADVHANRAALEAVLDHESSWDDVLFLGDAVVGGPEPNEVLTLLAGLRGTFLMGNHDREILRDLSRQASDPHQDWKQWTREQLSPTNLRFLAGFTDSCAVTRHGRDLRLFHGELPRAWGSHLWPDSPEEVFLGLAARYREPWILVAHSHVQFRRLVDGHTFINPGSIGQHRLGRNLACYGVLTDGTLSLKAIPYDEAATLAAMDRLPLERSYIESWKQGYRAGSLPVHRLLRDLSPLREMGYV